VEFLRHRLATDLYFVFVLAAGGEVVCELHSQPSFFGAAERLR
jgi:hypothetical protein